MTTTTQQQFGLLDSPAQRKRPRSIDEGVHYERSSKRSHSAPAEAPVKEYIKDSRAPPRPPSNWSHSVPADAAENDVHQIPSPSVAADASDKDFKAARGIHSYRKNKSDAINFESIRATRPDVKFLSCDEESADEDPDVYEDDEEDEDVDLDENVDVEKEGLPSLESCLQMSFDKLGERLQLKRAIEFMRLILNSEEDKSFEAMQNTVIKAEDISKKYRKYTGTRSSERAITFLTLMAYSFDAKASYQMARLIVAADEIQLFDP
ncbi:hypothetical protein BDQ17DRAFT_460923 [Cyathus striatus]|nr:hypothetical protein BDQ17DRAFT_460923 [Cyathus striatus]